MNNNFFYNLLKQRRSARRFTPQAVETEKLDLLLNSALMSPASKSTNEWEFIVVQDKTMLQQLSECKEHGAKLIANAPLAIVVAGDTTKSDVWIEDCSIASILLQLAAEEQGLGSCWVQVRNRKHKNGTDSAAFVRKLLQIPDNFAVLSIIAIGYKAEERPPFDEKNLQLDKIHYEKFLDFSGFKNLENLLT